MPLSAVQVKNAAPNEKAYKLTDERGMYLLVQANGSKLWRLNYRFAGKFKTLALGIYPDVSLSDARDKRDDARKLIANGVDPSHTRQMEKAAVRMGADNSFEEVAREWLDKQNFAD